MTDDIVEDIIEFLENQGKMEMIVDLRKFLKNKELKSDVSNQVQNIANSQIVAALN